MVVSYDTCYRVLDIKEHSPALTTIRELGLAFAQSAMIVGVSAEAKL